LVDRLDARAREALSEVGFDEASHILQQLENQVDKINNPSAYVLRAVGNAKQGKGSGGAGGPGPVVPHQGHMRSVDVLGGWRYQLDADAVRALDEIGPQAASAVLSELEAKAGSVRNPSAYVVKAVGNAKKGVNQPGTSGGSPRVGGDWLGRWRGHLDPKAIQALEEVGPDASASILRELESKSDTIKNFSAYAMRAAGNAKKEAQGSGMSTSNGLAPAAEIGEDGSVPDWRSMLDEKASACLAELDPEDAERIGEELDSKAQGVRNPSAYIMRAVANAKQGKVQPGSSASEAAAGKLQEELDRLPAPLDEKASRALEELPKELACKVLAQLNQQTAVNNPSAYVMKACANEKMQNLGNHRPAKRLRTA
jgi:hypothetical protein